MPLDLPHHFLRLGSHAEKQYFLDDRELYGGIIFNANLVSITTAACASLATTLSGHGKTLLLDPWTFVFGLESKYLMVERVKDGETRIDLKSSYGELASLYGEPISSMVADDAWQRGHTARLHPSHFNESSIQSFADSVLKYQRTALEEEMEEDEYFGVDTALQPEALIAPYFYIDPEETEAWLSLNLRLLDASLDSDEAGDIPIVPLICLSVSPLATGRRNTLRDIVRRYRERNCPGYFVWVSDFDETTTSTAELRGFLNLIEALQGDDNASVLNMFGGYYSAICTRLGLSGFSHSVGYGESKNVLPPSGGTPVAKYYFPPLHKRIGAEQALTMVTGLYGEDPDEFYREVCGCVVCQRLMDDGVEGFAAYAEAEKSDKPNLPDWLKDRKYPTGRAKELTNQHYLRARQNELDEVREAELAAIPDDLRDQLRWYNDHFQSPPFPHSEHLERWGDAIESAVSAE